MNAYQSLEDAKAGMARDVAALNFDGSTVTGRHRLISIDLLTGKLKARTTPDAKPCCYINLPTTAGEESARRMAQVITNPKLVVCLLSDEAWNDLTSTLWAYTNIRLLEHPQSLEGIKLSPEAAELFESRFPHH
jgi:hypothetical protein